MTAQSAPSPSGDSAPWPSQGRAWWAIGVFFASAILYYTDRFILNLLVDPIRSDLHISDTQVSLLQGAAFALVYAFAGLPLGRLADVVQRRRVIIAGVVTWSVATISCGVAQNLGQLFAARIGVGIGEAALAPAAVSMISDYFPPRRRGTALGVFLAGMSLGGGMSILVGGELLQAANSGWLRPVPIIGMLAPWRAVLVVLGLMSAPIVALLFTISEPVRRDRVGAAGAALSLRSVVAGFVSRRETLLPLYLALALASAGDIALGNWTPALLARRFSFTPGQIGTTLGLVALAAGGLGSILGGVFSDYAARRGGSRARVSVAFGACLLGLGGSAVALATTGYEVIFLFALWMLMLSVGESVGITLVQELVPNEMRGVGASLVSFGNMLIGLTLGTTLTALFTDYIYRDPLAVGLSITSVAAPAGAMAVLLFWRTWAALAARTGEPEPFAPGRGA